MNTLTPELRKRTEQSLLETKTMLAKELKFSFDLQNMKTVSFYKSHIVKLENMLTSGVY